MSTATASVRVPDSSASSGVRRRRAWIIYFVCLLLLGLWTRYCVNSLLHTGRELYRDYGSFYASGLAARQHLNPYDRYYPLVWRFQERPNGRITYDANLNPPCMLPFFELMARFDLQRGLLIFTICSALSIAAGSALLLWRRRLKSRTVVWLLLSGSVLNTLWVSHYFTFLFLFACVIWCLMDSGKTGLAAVCIGLLVAAKPNLGLWPVMLFLAGYGRQALISAATAIAASLAPVLFYGPQVYRQWMDASSILQHSGNSADISLAGIFARLGSRPLGIVLAVALVAGMLALVRRRRPSQVNLAGIAICTGILCSPLAWFHYSLFAAPFFAVLAWKRLETTAALFLFLPPFWAAFLLGPTPWRFSIINGVYFVGICLMLCSFGRSVVLPRAIEASGIGA